MTKPGKNTSPAERSSTPRESGTNIRTDAERLDDDPLDFRDDEDFTADAGARAPAGNRPGASGARRADQAAEHAERAADRSRGGGRRA